MEKKESPKPQAAGPQPQKSGFSQKISGLSNKAFGIIKFTLGICLLSFVYSFTVSLIDELSLIEKSYQVCLWSGVISFLLIYLFVWEPQTIYSRGYKILEVIFNFFKPLVRVAPYLLPIYTIILFLLYILLALFVKGEWLSRYLVFFFGFSIALHLVFSSKTLRAKKEDFLKANYIFGFSFIYIINLAILAMILNLIFNKFSFVNFSNNSFQIAKGVFKAVFGQLFL
jgi:hypothetical protein